MKKSIVLVFSLAFIFIAAAQFSLHRARAQNNSDPFPEEDIKKYEGVEKGNGKSDDTATSDVKVFEQDSVIISIKKISDEIKGYKTFMVTAKNQNDRNKTLNGKICLSNTTVKQPSCGSGECTVYMELKAKGSETRKWQCKEKSESSSWSFNVVKIYDF